MVPATRIVLHGPVAKETESDGNGEYVFDSVPAGSYTVEAKVPGLSGALAIEVKPGETSIVPIELAIDAVTNSVTVTASDPGPGGESAQSTTIAQSTVENAPNQTERFESLLPLVPGVVRGPDGRINMKGSRAAQSGWLVNSANVTDEHVTDG
jgi:hypothetical protein